MPCFITICPGTPTAWSSARAAWTVTARCAKTVKTIRYFSPDNPVDGVVLDVLLNKAREIHRTLGTYVPVPDESETVTEALLNALFLRGGRTIWPRNQPQMELGLEIPEVAALHQAWDLDGRAKRKTVPGLPSVPSSPTKCARNWKPPTLSWAIPMRFAISSSAPGSASV